MTPAASTPAAPNLERVRQRHRLDRGGPGGGGPGDRGGSVTHGEAHPRLGRLQQLRHHRERPVLDERPDLGQHGSRRGRVALD